MDLISFECFNRLSVENNVHLVWLTLFEQLGIYGWNLTKKKKRQDLGLYLKLTDRAVHFSQRESESKRFLDPFISIRPYSYSVRKSADPVGGRIESAGDRIKSNQRLIERRKKSNTEGSECGCRG